MSDIETIPFDPRTFGRGLVNSTGGETPASVLCDTHYAKIGVQAAWDPERVLRLCGLLQLTRYELASMILFPHAQMKQCMKEGLFPGTVCLMFSIIENQFVPEGYLMDSIPEDRDTPLIPTKILGNGSSKTP